MDGFFSGPISKHAACFSPPRSAVRITTRLIPIDSAASLYVWNCCSSVGEVADSAQDIGRYTGIPIIRIDEEMCREAARLGKRVGVLATLPTTLEPTKNTVSRVAREMNRHVELVDGLVDAFGADQDKFKALLCGKATEIADQVDVILLAQGSMAYAEDAIHEKIGKPVLSSPRFGAQALAAALKAKGL